MVTRLNILLWYCDLTWQKGQQYLQTFWPVYHSIFNQHCYKYGTCVITNVKKVFSYSTSESTIVTLHILWLIWTDWGAVTHMANRLPNSSKQNHFRFSIRFSPNCAAHIQRFLLRQLTLREVSFITDYSFHSSIRWEADVNSPVINRNIHVTQLSWCFKIFDWPH